MNRPAGVYVLAALGANLGDPIEQLRGAIGALRAGGLDIDRISSAYLTAPVGFEKQPDFHNLVLSGRTDLTVFDLHAVGARIEREMGRERTVANGPRVIDIDLLSYGDLVYQSPDLTIPHPRMHLRSFVLWPLAEIAREWRHPATGASSLDMIRDIPTPSPVRPVNSEW